MVKDKSHLAASCMATHCDSAITAVFFLCIHIATHMQSKSTVYDVTKAAREVTEPSAMSWSTF